MKENNTIITHSLVASKIFVIRGQKVMLDEDLAKLYQVKTKRLNEQIKRNKERFPEDFMFPLTKEEFYNLKSQNATSSWGGRRKPPNAFTEHGVLMLSSVLKSKRSIEVNIQIMRVFTKMREILFSHKDLNVKIGKIESTLEGQSHEIKVLFEYLKKLMDDKVQRDKQTKRQRIGFKSGEK